MADLLEFTSDPDETPISVPTLICAVHGHPFDVGGVSGSIGSVLGEGKLIATFDPDLVYDFRAERPIIVHDEGSMSRLIDPRLEVYLVNDLEGNDVLVLRGAEPDLRWHSLADGILQVCSQFGVERFYAVGGIAAGIPHTRPVDLFVRSFLHPDPTQDSEFSEYSSFPDFLVYVLGAAGLDTYSVLARVPFYLGQGTYASAAAGVMTYIADHSGRSLPIGDLERAAMTESDQVAAAFQGNEEFVELVANLEADYDSGGPGRGLTLPVDKSLKIPTADELGAAAEEFLAHSAEGHPRNEYRPLRGGRLTGPGGSPIFPTRKGRHAKAADERTREDGDEQSGAPSADSPEPDTTE